MWFGLHEFYFKSCAAVTDDELRKVVEEIKGDEENVIVTITSGLTTMTDVLYVVGEVALAENVEFGTVTKGSFFDLLKNIVLRDADPHDEVYVSVHNIPWSPNIIKNFCGGDSLPAREAR